MADDIFLSSHADSAPALILWFFDSRGGVSADGTPLPDWVDASVAGWISRETALMDAAWGHTPRSALAFVHIAPPRSERYVDKAIIRDHLVILGADDPLGDGSVQDSLGIATEDTSSSNKPINIAAGARDAPFWEAVGGIPNLHAIISGHAHGNEWCAREPGLGVRFCFNKHSGYGGYDKAGWGHGVRNVMFSLSPTGNLREGTVLNAETWIQLESGEQRSRVNL
ncbi:hypothetical protein B0H16DRAFT_1454750 [Mycena metata]|uniref:Calcineurin-like phosphoesterase domain-containing protein n=1 Tax=Mycena metata TaxID=1033252 RepID=A0AAD7JG60_9AGAR|nr:hypothetical protein B0H16DRAFT_1454750 [Mycena metata]